MKVRKRILHIENHIQDRQSIAELFDKEVSLCSDIFHCGSVDRSPGELTSIAEYLHFIRENRDNTDFIIMDLGLTVAEEDQIKLWFATEFTEFEDFASKATGIRLLDGIISSRLFPPERIAVYTQFNPKYDLFKDLNQMGKVRWNGTVIKTFYKDGKSDPRDLKEHVEQQCGVRTTWIYYFSADFALRKRIEGTIQALDRECDTDLVRGFCEDQPVGAVDRYKFHYAEKRFRVALIDLVQNPADKQTIEDVREKGEWADMLKLSTIPLIRTIEEEGKQKTQTVALTNGHYEHGMVRQLMDAKVGADWVLNADLVDLNIFSTLWRMLRRVRA